MDREMAGAEEWVTSVGTPLDQWIAPTPLFPVEM